MMFTKTLLMSAALLTTALAPVRAAPMAQNPQEFVLMAIQGDDAEIALGQLAQQKGGRDRVRDLGKTISDDHTTARQQAMDVAKTLNVTPPTGPTQAENDERAKLSGLSGDAFDREYLTHVIDDHNKDISDYQAEARDDHGPAGQLAGQQLPVLQRHLQLARAISMPNAAAATSATALNFLKQEGPDTWRASKVIGVPIYGPNNAKVGDINDVLMDHDGRATGIVVGIGGVLGIGEKNVGLPYGAVRFSNNDVASDNAAANGAVGGPHGDRQSSTAYPYRGDIAYTADQLKAAPSFGFVQ